MHRGFITLPCGLFSRPFKKKFFFFATTLCTHFVLLHSAHLASHWEFFNVAKVLTHGGGCVRVHVHYLLGNRFPIIPPLLLFCGFAIMNNMIAIL